MGQDIQSPLLEVLDLVLLLADNHRHFRFLQPLQLTLQLLICLLRCGLFKSGFCFRDLFCPVFLCQVVHPYTGHLIQTYKHSLAGSPNISIMLHEILGNCFQTRLCRQHMDLFGEFQFQLFLLAGIQISCFNGINDLLGDFRVLDRPQLFTTVFVVQWYGCAVIHRPLEIVHRDVTTKGALCDRIIGEQRCAGKTNTGGSRQQRHHILRKNAILAPVCLVGHDNNIVIGNNGLSIPLVELLNQREDEAGIALQLADQVIAALRYVFGGLDTAQQTAILKGVADLLVQFVTVGQHHKGGRTLKLAADLLCQEQHGVALAAALCVPKHTQSAISQLSLLVHLHRFIDTQILMVPSEDLGGAATGVVIENEILKQI